MFYNWYYRLHVIILAWLFVDHLFLIKSPQHFYIRHWKIHISKVFETYSPNKRTAVTETTIAITGDEILSRKIGMASTAAALASSKVTSSRWWRLTMGRILLACLCCFGVPPSLIICRVIRSRERSPIVKPDINPTRDREIWSNT